MHFYKTVSKECISRNRVSLTKHNLHKPPLALLLIEWIRKSRLQFQSKWTSPKNRIHLGQLVYSIVSQQASLFLVWIEKPLLPIIKENSNSTEHISTCKTHSFMISQLASLLSSNASTQSFRPFSPPGQPLFQSPKPSASRLSLTFCTGFLFSNACRCACLISAC
jgi:hypothetical protein